MPPKTPTPRNDGWTDIAYDFGSSAADNARLSALLNEACHVFRRHAEGAWVSRDKDAYAVKLADEIEVRPGLVGHLLATGDRVIQMLTYRAVEIAKARGRAPAP